MEFHYAILIFETYDGCELFFFLFYIIAYWVPTSYEDQIFVFVTGFFCMLSIFLVVVVVGGEGG